MWEILNPALWCGALRTHRTPGNAPCPPTAERLCRQQCSLHLMPEEEHGGPFSSTQPAPGAVSLLRLPRAAGSPATQPGLEFSASPSASLPQGQSKQQCLPPRAVLLHGRQKHAEDSILPNLEQA